MTNLFCNAPDLIKCLDPRCWLSTPCNFADKCIKRVINNHILYYQCACDFKENDLQVYMIPSCVGDSNCVPTNSPTQSPSLSPTQLPSSPPSPSPSSSPSPFITKIEDEFDMNYLYYIGSGVFFLVILLIYFRKTIKKCLCNSKVNNKENDDEEEDDEEENNLENTRNSNYKNCMNELNN